MALIDQDAGARTARAHGHIQVEGALAGTSNGMRAWARPAGLFVLAILSLAGYLAIRPRSAVGLYHPAGIAFIELALAVPYGLACWWIIVGNPSHSRSVRCVEWAVIIGAAAGFFALVFPLWPSLSGDAYRYVWDARLTAHGYNPLVLAPENPLLAQLRDATFYPHLYWVHVPTIYPPAAQALYLVAYLIAPDNIWAIKVEMVLGVAAVATLLVAYLRARGQNPMRVVVWLWCPLVVVEFGLDGHVDAAAIAFWLAALVLADRTRGRGALVGSLLGVATLIKLYPALFVFGMGRRSDRYFFVAFLGTIAAGYLPFLHNGLPTLGFLGVYAGDAQSYGALLFWLRNLFLTLGIPEVGVQAVTLIAAALAIGGVVWARWRRLLADAVAVSALLVLWLTLTPHLQPWYVTALAPMCALYLDPPTQSLRSALTGTLWLGVCLMPAFDIAFDSAYRNLEWFYAAIYLMVAAGSAAALIGFWLRRRQVYLCETPRQGSPVSSPGVH